MHQQLKCKECLSSNAETQNTFMHDLLTLFVLPPEFRLSGQVGVHDLSGKICLQDKCFQWLYCCNVGYYMPLKIPVCFQDFWPITVEVPRVLLPLANVPLIDWSLEWLATNNVEEVSFKISNSQLSSYLSRFASGFIVHLHSSVCTPWSTVSSQFCS